MLLPSKHRLGLLPLVFWACTPAVREPIDLPARLQSYFGACYPSEGALDLELPLRADAARVPVELDWVAQAGAPEWELEVNDPIGRPLARIGQRPDGTLTSEGKLVRHWGSFTADEQGFLVVRGYRLGLRADELPCLLAMHLPKAWAGRVSERVVEPGSERLAIAEDERAIELTFRAERGGVPEGVCARISWSYFWGLQRPELSWCFDKLRRQSEMKLPKGWQLNWTKSDA